MEEFEIKSFEKLSCVIRYPKEYCPGGRYPILLFLHGSGTRGIEIEKLLENPFFKTTNGKDLPFITIAPQCYADTWFDVFESLCALAKHIYSSDFTDQKRVYAIGASMGGYGVWQLAMSCPELFAAIVPICGGGMSWNAGRLKNVPAWAFHGKNDPTVSPEESRNMVEAVNKKGGNAKLTLYENCGHDAWSQTYSNNAVYAWLLSFSKQETPKEKTIFDNSKIYG